MLAEVADDLVVGSLPAAAAAGTGDPGAPGLPEWREASRWREIEIELVTGSHGDKRAYIGAQGSARGALGGVLSANVTVAAA